MVIKKYPSAAFISESPDWSEDKQQWFSERCATRDFGSVGKYFDVLGWWNDQKTKFPKIFPSAMVWIAKPATNAFQERVFSVASWFHNNRLMRQEDPKTFEMRTLGRLNRQLLQDILDAEDVIDRNMKNRKQPPKKASSVTNPGEMSTGAAALNDARPQSQANTTSTSEMVRVQQMIKATKQTTAFSKLPAENTTDDNATHATLSFVPEGASDTKLYDEVCFVNMDYQEEPEESVDTDSALLKSLKSRQQSMNVMSTVVTTTNTAEATSALEVEVVATPNQVQGQGQKRNREDDAALNSPEQATTTERHVEGQVEGEVAQNTGDSGCVGSPSRSSTRIKNRKQARTK